MAALTQRLRTAVPRRLAPVCRLLSSGASFPVCSAADLSAATTTLRERQAPSKEALKEGGRAAGLHTVEAVVVIPGTAEDPVHEVFVRSDVHVATVPGTDFLRFGLDPVSGGPDPPASSTSPPALTMQSVAACAGVTMRAVATSMGLSYDRLVLTAEADYDERGPKAISRSVPIGFQGMRLHLDVVTVHCLANGVVHSQKDWERLLSASEHFCVVAQTLLGGFTGANAEGEPGPSREAQTGALTTTLKVWHDEGAAREMLGSKLGPSAAGLPLAAF